MNQTPSIPDLPLRRLVRWAVMFPLAIFAWVLWQQLLARVFYAGVFQPGLSWIEGTAEAVFVLVAAVVAPARKRVVALVSLGFFLIRDVAITLLAPAVVTPRDAAVAIALACLATAIVWWQADTRASS